MVEPVACAACGQENVATQRFCGACGRPLGRTCRQCGDENPAAFQFCGSCGTALDSTGAGALTEERRVLTVLFADLSGFTNFSERSDPEDVRDMVDRCMRRMGEAVERYGAAVTRVVGDELMAIFGAPVAHEDDPARAVRAGLEIQRLAAEHPEEFGGLAVRVGVNTGELMFATGRPRRQFHGHGRRRERGRPAPDRRTARARARGADHCRRQRARYHVRVTAALHPQGQGRARPGRAGSRTGGARPRRPRQRQADGGAQHRDGRATRRVAPGY